MIRSRWHFMLIGIIAWLVLGALGLRWTARPLLWIEVGTLCDCEMKTIEIARREFPIHVAAFPTDATNSVPAAADDAELPFADEATRAWALREMRNRFVIVFVLWMAAGWFIHWCLGKLARGSGS